MSLNFQKHVGNIHRIEKGYRHNQNRYQEPRGKVVHQDYDLNSWAGDRRVPNAEQDAKLDTDPDFFMNQVQVQIISNLVILKKS